VGRQPSHKIWRLPLVRTTIRSIDAIPSAWLR
jgi:hypothetical protein